MLMRTGSNGRAGAPHAVVIGCGVGGLAAGARLAAKGYRVTMVDKLDGPGGRAYTYRQDGFTFDAGPTIITAPYVFEDLWKACGGNLQDDVDIRLTFEKVDAASDTLRGDLVIRVEEADIVAPSHGERVVPGAGGAAMRMLEEANPVDVWRENLRRGIG